MVETKRHGDAFDYYYSLGEKRGFPSVALHCKCSERAVANWSKEFNWQERIILRDLEVNQRTEAKTNDAIVNTKADYRKLIKEQLGDIETLDGYMMALVGGVYDLIAKKKMKVTEMKELLDVIKSHQFSTSKKVELMKTDLLLMGEADSRSEEKIIIVNDLEGAKRED